MVEEKDSHLTNKSSAAGHPAQVKLIFLHLLWTSPRGSKAASGVSNISYLDFSFHLKVVDIFHVV